MRKNYILTLSGFPVQMDCFVDFEKLENGEPYAYGVSTPFYRPTHKHPKFANNPFTSAHEQQRLQFEELLVKVADIPLPEIFQAVYWGENKTFKNGVQLQIRGEEE